MYHALRHFHDTRIFFGSLNYYMYNFVTLNKFKKLFFIHFFFPPSLSSFFFFSISLPPLSFFFLSPNPFPHLRPPSFSSLSTPTASPTSPTEPSSPHSLYPSRPSHHPRAPQATCSLWLLHEVVLLASHHHRKAHSPLACPFYR